MQEKNRINSYVFNQNALFAPCKINDDYNCIHAFAEFATLPLTDVIHI